MNILYRIIDKHEIPKISQIDRSDHSEITYCFKHEQLILEPKVFHHPGLNKTDYIPYINELGQMIDNGGFLWGAFFEDRLVGIACIENQLVGKNKNMLNLHLLWVSKAMRRNGIANELINLCKQDVINRNIDKLYISASPSKNTIDFYLSIGCKVTAEVDSGMFQKEPEDIHLELKL